MLDSRTCPVCRGRIDHEGCDCSDEVVEAIRLTREAMLEGAEFFYTTHYPHRWSSGASMRTLNPDNGFNHFLTLDEARETAEAKSTGRPGYEDYCETTFGMAFPVNGRKGYLDKPDQAAS